MPRPEQISDFYRRLPDHAPGGVSLDNAGIGHINVFVRDGCSATSPYHRRDFYKVSLIIGTGKLYYADKFFAVDRPAVLFSNPVVPYSWEAESAEQSGWYCLFTDAFIQHSERVNSLQDSPLFRIGANPLFFPDAAQLEELSGIYRKMIHEIQGTYAHKYDVLRSYLHLLIHEAMKADPAANFGSYSNGSARVSGLFLELLERQFPVDSPAFQLQLRTPADFARSLSVHVNHLNRAVRDVTGKTTSEHIAARLIKEAKALLIHTDWTITEVAYSLGFEYPSYFTLFFKKHTGVSPHRVRTAHV